MLYYSMKEYNLHVHNDHQPTVTSPHRSNDALSVNMHGFTWQRICIGVNEGGAVCLHI